MLVFVDKSGEAEFKVEGERKNVFGGLVQRVDVESKSGAVCEVSSCGVPRFMYQMLRAYPNRLW